MNTEKQIEFNKVKEIWAGLAITEYAKDKIRNKEIILDETALRKELKDTTNSRNMIEKLGIPPLQDMTEINEILTVAGRGDCLSQYKLERVENVTVVAERLKDYLSRGRQYDNPLAYYDENLDGLSELRDEINRQIRNGAVDDRASKSLFEIRTKITGIEDSMKQKAEQVIRNAKDCMSDTYYTMRNGRVCVPVKKECKFKVPGSVIDKSSTGSTLFIEPTGVAKLTEELQLLKIDEENEVYRILYTLTAMVSDHIGKRKKFIRPDSFFKKMMTSNHKKNFEYPIGTGITKDLTVNDACVGCGMCARLCPTANIKIENGRPVFGNKCLSCGACIQNCPQNALHHNKEKSGARYRNPNVSVEELMQI